MQTISRNTVLISWLQSWTDQNTYKIVINFTYRDLLHRQQTKNRVLVFISGSC